MQKKKKLKNPTVCVSFLVGYITNIIEYANRGRYTGGALIFSFSVFYISNTEFCYIFANVKLSPAFLEL